MFGIIATYQHHKLSKYSDTLKQKKNNRYCNFPRPQLFSYMSDDGDDDAECSYAFYLIWIITQKGKQMLI